ncbi:MAG: septum site-determining protein MinC [Proteobacteria bacterium]|jgi:septum site-determining protein MinC|nr:septum site-determining protein MinC [Pseudomonadota bacterium]
MSTTAAVLPVSVLAVQIEDDVPVLTIPADLPFDTLKEWVLEQVPSKLDQIGGRTCRLAIGNRNLEIFDLRRLLHLLKEEFEVDVSGLYATNEAIKAFAERELKLKLWERALDAEETHPDEEEVDEDAEEEEVEPNKADEEQIEQEEAPDRPQTEQQIPVDPGRRTLNLHHTLRSGKVVRFEGDVVVFGDVNPGAQVVAAGNIVVLGALKGMVHAGASGNENSFIISLNMFPTQIRIGRKIAILPDATTNTSSLDPTPSGTTEALARLRSGATRWFNSDQGSKSINKPQIASVIGGQIIIEPYQGKVFR